MTSIKGFGKRVFGTSKIMTAVAVVMIAVGIVMSLYFVAGWMNKQQTEQKLESSVNNSQSGTSTTTNSASQTYTAAEVATHNSLSDCWMIINGSVYDVTEFLEQHPGGADSMARYCGQEATQAFMTQGRGGGRTHSQMATQLKEDYRVGTLQN